MRRTLRQAGTILAGLLLLLVCAVAPGASAATPADFKTPEYWASTGLELINAASAYAQGYTGEGIVLGIIDTPVRASHPELEGKVLGMLLPTGYPLGNWTEDAHGSHVAGIMVAASDDIGMEGVAYDADLYAVALDLRESVTTRLPWPNFLAYFAALPSVKIINNSWGGSIYPYDRGDIVQYVWDKVESEPEYQELITLATTYGKLIVFAAGNDGNASPCLEAILPRYYPTLTSWLNVVSLDAAGITIDASGNKTGDVQSVSVFSNLAAGSQLFSISAPGSNIYSLDAVSGTGYTYMSGTSMAAPYVSGALALVQQAFPWMTSKQLADTVLTTADNPTNQRFTAPEFTITMNESQMLSGATGLKILIYYIDTPVSSDIANDLTTYYAKNSATLQSIYGINTLADFLAVYAGTYTVMNAKGEIIVTSIAGSASSVAFADVYGQGILDVGLAVRGPAILDANRLARTDYSSTYQSALYSVNTQGYTGVWSNDISERQWINSLHHALFQYNPGDDPTDPYKADAVALINQHVGLLKDGAGTLILTGYNTYAGATVVRGGTLSITRQTGVTNSGTLVNSNVTVESAGTLTGDGAIVNTLTNAGLVIPGNVLGDSLSVGTYVQQTAGSDLFLRVTTAGDHTTLNTSQLTLGGGKITVATPQAYHTNQSVSFPFSSLIAGTVTTASGFDWSTDVVAGSYNTTSGAISTTWPSPTLQALVNVAQDAGGTPTTLTLTFSRPAGSYSRYGGSGNARAVGVVFDQAAGQVTGDAQNLVAALDFSDPSGGQVASALQQLGPRQFAAASKSSMLGQQNISTVLLSHLLPATATGGSARPSGVASGDAPIDVWHAFVEPLGGLGYANAQDGQAASTTGWAGLLAGISTDVTTDRGAWTLGGHGSFIHLEQYSGGPGTNHTITNGVYLGGQFRFAPSALATPTAGLYVFGLARGGLESTSQQRTVVINSYVRTAKSDWLSPVGSLLGGAGWDYTPPALGNRLTFGPLGWLEYSAAWRPPVAEYGGLAANLKLRDNWSQSLRSSLGGHISLDIPTKAVATSLRLEASAVWNHALLDEYGSLQARFADFGGTFTFHDTVIDRDTATITTGLTATLANNVSLGLKLGTELGPNHADGWGGLKIGWTF